jgi:hypothetical protein
MSALRFTVAAGERQPILTMPVEMLTSASQSNLAALPVDFSPNVLACATTGNWSPPAPGTFGALREAPTYDCSKGQTLGQVSDKAVIFDLSSFVSETNRTVSIVILPGTSPVPIPSPPVALPIPALPPVLLQTTFDITFKPVTIAAVEVLPAPAVTEDDFGFEEPVVDDSSFYNAGGTDSGFALGNPTTPTAPARGGLSVLPRAVVRQVGAVKTEAQRTERAVAAGVFLLLCMWAWSVADRNGVPGVADARPFRTLYDGNLTPSRGPARSGFGTLRRVGKPPSLR